VSNKTFSTTKRAKIAGTAGAGVLVVAGMVTAGMPPQLLAAAGGVSALASVGMFWYSIKILDFEEKRIVSAAGLNQIYENIYTSQVFLFSFILSVCLF